MSEGAKDKLKKWMSNVSKTLTASEQTSGIHKQPVQSSGKPPASPKMKVKQVVGMSIANTAAPSANMSPGVSKSSDRGVPKSDLPIVDDPTMGAYDKKGGVPKKDLPLVDNSAMGKNSDERRFHEKGVHQPSVMSSNPGRSPMGHRVKAGNMNHAKGMAKRILQQLKAMPKANLPVAKAEKLQKPYASDAQRRWAHTDKGTKALGGEAAVHHWDEETKGKDIPEKVSKNAAPGINNKKFDSCVNKVKAKGSATNAYAVCNAALKKQESNKMNTLKPPKSNPKDPILNPTMPQQPASESYKQKSQQYVQSKMQKDDQPHRAGSPEERSHAVAEGQVSLYNALKDLPSSAGKKKFFDHLKTLGDSSKLRSPKNIMTKSEENPKYVTVHQHWYLAGNKIGKQQPEHMNDLHAAAAHGKDAEFGSHDHPVKKFGYGTYKVHPGGKLELVDHDYYTSD